MSKSKKPRDPSSLSPAEKMRVRNRWKGFILYETDYLQMKYFEYIVEFCKYPYLWIKHKGETPRALPFSAYNDFSPGSEMRNGEKKDHIHFYVEYPEPITGNSVATHSHGAISYCEPLTSIHAASLYLLHADFRSQLLGKTQYSITDVHASSLSLINEIFFLDKGHEEIAMIGDIYEAGKNTLTFKQLLTNLLQMRNEGNPRAEDAVIWALKHPQAIKMMFPIYPNSVHDLAVLANDDKFTSIKDFSVFFQEKGWL